MEKAILQTLIYADIFDYPLKAWEIHKWLLKKKCNLTDVEQALSRLLNKKKISQKKGFYVLRNRTKLIDLRIDKKSASEEYLRSAKFISRLFKVIPWIRLVGISGDLSMENATKESDIDLFIITQKKRLWLSRLSVLVILSLLEKRRRKSDSAKRAAGKFCLNLLVEENQLEQSRKDLYTAHEVLQMKPLWERNKVYTAFLQKNEWAFDYIPNWLTGMLADSKNNYPFNQGSRIIGWVESFVRFMQLRYMGYKPTAERISSVAVYFHPDDMQPKVLVEFEKRSKKYLK